jgi:hypothetical protein
MHPTCIPDPILPSQAADAAVDQASFHTLTLGAGHSTRSPLPPQELLRAFALSRGWVGPSGLPDETRCSRRILKDYVEGKLLYCKPPPGSGLQPYTGKAPAPAPAARQHHHQQAQQAAQQGLGAGQPAAAGAASGRQEAGSDAALEPGAAREGGGMVLAQPAPARASGPSAAAAPGAGLADGEPADAGASTGALGPAGAEGAGGDGPPLEEAVGALALDAADLELLEDMELAGGAPAPSRAVGGLPWVPPSLAAAGLQGWCLV